MDSAVAHALGRAIDLIGLQKLAAELGITYQAVRKWQTRGRMPRTEWTGETDYARRIERLTGGKVTAVELLEASPEVAV